MENLEKTKITKILSTILIVILLFNVFSPCLSFAAYKQDGQDKYNVLRVSNITKSSSGNYVFYVEYAAIADTYIGSFDMSLSYDTSKFATARKDTGAANTSVARVTDTNSDCFTFQTKTASNGSIRMLGTTTDWWCATDDGDSSTSFGSELSIFKVYFYLLDPSQWKLDGSKEITSDMISLKSTASSQTGYKQRIAQDVDGTSPTYITDTKYLATEGFAEKEKTVSSISVKTNPSKTTYEHDDTINLAGGVLKVTYDDNSTEDISMTDSNVKITKPSTGKADVNNQTITISYKGKTTTLKLNVTDPVKSLAVATPMTKVEYNHGETFNFTGLSLKATKKSGATINLTPSSSGVTKSETTANVNSANFTKTSAEGTVPVSGIQKITFTYEGKTTTQSVAVNDTISSIALTKQPTKTVYKQGENLDLTGAVVQVTLGSGGKANINLPDGSVTVSTYNPSTTGSKQHLTVKLGTATASNTIDVEAYNYISNSTLVKPSKTSYKYGEALDLKGGKLDFTWKSGNMTNASLTTDMVSGYSATKLGTQTITVKYNAKYTLSDGNTVTDTITKTFTISVDNEAKSIEITPPSKTQYNYGSKLDLAGGKISVKYADGTTENVTMTADMITEDDGSTVNMSPDVTSFVDNKYSKTLKISYTEDEATKTVNYPITIINDIKSIAMHTTPTKTKYNVNDTLDVTNGEIKIVRAVGNPEIKTITSNMVSGFDSSKENTKLPLTVSYTENGITKTTTYNVSVEDTVTAVSMKNTPKTDYKYNEPLDLSNGTITITKGSGTKDIAITKDMVSGYDPTKLGKQTLTITYGGKTTSYEVNVKDYVTGISITPNAITGKYNSELQNLINDNNIMYTITYAKAGAKTPTALTESMVSGYNKTKVTDQTLTITYQDTDIASATNGQQFKANLKVSLSNPTQSIVIKQKPTKTEYGYGDTIDLSNGKITITKANGDTEEKALTDSSVEVTETDGSAVDLSKVTFGKDNTATKTIKVTYDGKDTTYQIKITNKITGIKMHTTPKAQYNVNDALDLTTDGSNPGEILVTRQTGTPSVVSIKDSNVKVTGFDSSKENTKLPLTVSYTENGETKTTTYDVSIKDTVTAIKISQTPKTNYKYNEELDVSTGKIKITKGSGTTTIPMTASMVTGYDKTKLGDQELTVTYGGKTEKYKVNVKDYVTGISINPSSITGKYGTELEKIINDNDIIYTVTYAKAGAKSPKALTESMVAGYNKTSLTAQNLTVTYTDQDTNSYTNGKTFTTNLSVKLENEISKVTITPPTKTEYNHGDQIDLTGGKITVTYTDGTTKEEPITSATVTEKDGGAPNMSPTAAEYGSGNTVNKKLTFKYTASNGVTGTVDYPITIKDYIKSITMHTTPTKTKYNVNDLLDVTNGEIKIIRASGKAEIKELTEEMVSGFDSSKENTKLPLTVSYTENGITKTTTYNVSVEDTVTAVSMKNTPKTDYKYNEPLDLSNGTITITKGSGTKDIAITKDMVSGYDPTKLGKQTLTITYGGKTTSYEVNVKDYVTGISITPNAITGKYNSELQNLINDNNIMYTITYAKAGAKTPTALTESMVSGYNKTKVTDQTLTITYQDTDIASATNGQQFKANLKVSLSNPTQSIVIKQKPTKTEYGYGDTIDLSNGKITITKANGDTEEKALTDSSVEVTETDGSAVDLSKVTFGKDNTATKTIKVTYDGKDTTYQIKITNKITGIKMHTTPKAQYNVNDALDLTTDGSNPGEILVTRQTGTPSVVSIKDSNVKVTGFDSSKENTKLPLTVSYTENGETKTTTYDVSIKDTVTAIKISQTPKTNYKYNEELDVSTGKIKITKGSGTTTIPMTASMVTGYDKTKLGDQELTVTYGGKTEKYKVNVKDYVTGISINPSSITGKYGTELEKIINDNDIIYTVTYAKAGAKSPKALTESMVAGYNKTSLTAQNLTVTYTDQDTNSYTNGKTFTTNLSVKLENEISKVTITPPTKTEYNHGDQIDLTGGKITVTYTDGTTKEEPITSAIVTEKDGGAPNMSPTISEYGKGNTVNKTLTLKYTAEKGVTGTVDYQIKINDLIKTIEIKTTPTKTRYNVNEELDVTDGKINITRLSGRTEIKEITKEMVSGFDSSKENRELPLTVSCTENGITKTTTYKVSVEDQITSMKIIQTPKTNYKYNEELDVSTGKIEITKGSGTTTIPITPSMVTGYDKTKLGDQELTVTYGGKTEKYKVNVKDYVTGVILTPPTKVKYEYGEALELTGGNIQEVMASGAATSPVALTDSKVTISGYNPKQEGAQTIDVIYKGQKEQFGVIVENNIQSIIMKNTPKTEYKYGEPLNIAGGTIETIRSNGAKETINITTSMVTGYNPNKIGKQKITVTYKDKTTAYEVDVKDYIEDIDIVKPNKLVYEIGEKIDLTGGKVKPIMASKTATTPVAMTNSEVQIEGFDTSTEGAKTIKVTYKGHTKTFGITVIDQTSSMTIKTLPNKLEYKYGESLDLTGGTIEFKQGSETKIINITKDMITGYNSKKIGNQTLKVTYEGLTQEFIVNVKDYITKLELKKPEKKDYEYGENLDLTGGTISIITASGKVDEKIDITASMISGYDKTKEGTQTITVEYKGLQGKFQVSVKDKIKAISLNNEPNKINYKYGEALDITGATIDIIKSSGIYTIPVTDEMISGYNPQNSGLQVVTITYKGFKTKFLVLVTEKEEVKEPEQEEIKQEEPKTEVIKTVTKNKTIIINNNTKEDKEEQPTEEKVETPINEENNQKPNTEPTEEKETATLGVKDEKIKGNKQIAEAIGIAGLILLLLLLFFKRNVKIYVEEDGEFVLGGIDKLTKKHPELNVDEYLDGETYPNKVKIHLSDTISEKLDGKEIQIKHRGKIIKIKIVYDDKPYELILK